MENNEEMIKSLTSLIDETLEEFEELKKSKFAAQEISLGDSSSGIKDKSKNGDLETKKKEDDEDDEDDEEDVEKGENEKADSDAGKFAQAPSVSKGENEKADSDAGKFAQAPSVSKGEECDDDEDEEEEDDKMKKSIEESEDLIKSYIDHRFEAMQEQLEKMAAIIESIADQPVDRRGVPAGVAPLNKSAEETYEPLNKSDVADQLFELKKSGKEVDSMDIFKVETGNENTVLEIANKYGLR
jgi:hypothetical protein